MKIIIILGIYISFAFANASVPERKEDYLKYLELKRKAVVLNLDNLNTKKFIPQDVIWIEDEGPKMVPRPDPYRKVFSPRDPDANQHGVVNYPNIKEEVEKKRLAFIDSELKKLKSI